MSSPEHPDKIIPVFSLTGNFEELFKKYYAYVCQVIFRYVPDRGKTEDIAQELFTEVWMKRESLQIHTSVSAYLRKMAISRALNYLRDTRKYQWDELDALQDPNTEASQRDPAVILEMERADLQRLIEAAIRKLPEKCRVVFLLSREEELTYAEISRQLNISVKTVENQIAKALKLIRTTLIEHRG